MQASPLLPYHPRLAISRTGFNTSGFAQKLGVELVPTSEEELSADAFVLGYQD
jgi:hypothetical protein